jgi:hypothetical protein
MKRIRRHLSVVCVAAALLLVGGTGQAFAAFVYFANPAWGQVPTSGVRGPANPLTEVKAYMPTNSGCVNAIEVPTGLKAGATICGFGTIYHAYCGCAQRYGWAGDDPYEGPTPIDMYAYESW